MKSRSTLIRLLVVAIAVCTISDGRGRVAYAQANVDPDVARARTAINRGQYADAENILKAPALRNPNGDAALELALLYDMLGRRAEAQPIFTRLANLPSTPRTTAAEYARLGRAARALRQMQLANDAYRLATEAAPKDPAYETGWGELFLETHNDDEAVKSFQKALELDSSYEPAKLGLARTLIDANTPAAEKLAGEVLAADPMSVQAHLILAEAALDNSDRVAAKSEIAKAKAINPSSLDTLALSAAVAYVEDRLDEFKTEAAAALRINPRFADAYRVPADRAAAAYRFEEAVALNRQALEVDPDDLRVHAALGVQLLRTGDEAEARQHLERAYDKDHFDERTVFLLRMLDKLDKFEVIRDGDLILKFDPSETAVMKEFVAPLAHKALDQYAKKYQFTPKGPIIIEMFPKHDDFAVRTVGLPGMVGALGACFGRVVTLDSPKARPPGDFNWEPTLWHELGHVITLQLSKQRVPRWLTEGISVYEEKLGSPAWGREGELTFVAAYSENKHMSLRELNAAFTDPEKIPLGYYEASLLAEFIVNTYGMPALRKLLVTYGEGKEGEEALKIGLGVDIDTLQAGFDKLLSAKYATIVKAMAPPKELEVGANNVETIAAANPNSYPAQIALGEFLWKAGHIDEAYKALEHAAQLVPIAPGPKSPHALMAQIAMSKGDHARAIRELQAQLQTDHTDVEAARVLVKEIEQGAPNDTAQLLEVRSLIAQLDPFDATNMSALGRLRMRAGDAQDAQRELRAAIAAGVLDQAAAHTDLAESYLATGDKAAAKKEVLAAIEAAPGYSRALSLLLRVE